MASRRSPLAPAMEMTLAERRPRAAERDVSAWLVRCSYEFEDEMVWKSGGTGGYATFIGFSTKSRRDFILLSNAADYDPNTRLGVHLVNAAYALPKLRRAGAGRSGVSLLPMPAATCWRRPSC